MTSPPHPQLFMSLHFRRVKIGEALWFPVQPGVSICGVGSAGRLGLWCEYLAAITLKAITQYKPRSIQPSLIRHGLTEHVRRGEHGAEKTGWTK